MKVCVVGSGGREHSLALALARTADVIVTPGNPGMPVVTPEGERQCVLASPRADQAHLHGHAFTPRIFTPRT